MASTTSPLGKHRRKNSMGGVEESLVAGVPCFPAQMSEAMSIVHFVAVEQGHGAPSWLQRRWKTVRRAFECGETVVEQTGTSDRGKPKWRNLVRKLKRNGRITRHRSKPVSFHYDAFSYALNFDEGCGHEPECPKYLYFSSRYAAPVNAKPKSEEGAM
eukprot:Gb_19814 [translate_table: standard]